jgi:hypothetical protein
MAVTTLINFGRKERQKSNLGGLARIILFGASQFTAEWPKESNIAAGEISTALPLKPGTTGAVLTFDIGSGRAKTKRSGVLGNQTYMHDIECMMAGISKEQSAAVALTDNEGVVAIAYHKDGTAQVIGSSVTPITLESESDTGAMGTDKKFISLKGVSADALAWGDVFLASTVTVPLPAAEEADGEPAWFSEPA